MFYSKILKYVFLFLFIFICSCASNKDEIKNNSEPSDSLYTVKVINNSLEKVLLRYESADLKYTFKFIDSNNEIKFKMLGNLTVQYVIQGYSDAKVLRIQQHTLIHVKKDDIFIDDLPKDEIIKNEN